MKHAARWLALFMLVAPAVADDEMVNAAIKKIKQAVRAKDADACKVAFSDRPSLLNQFERSRLEEQCDSTSLS